MAVEVLKKSIVGVYEIIHSPFIDKRGQFLNIFRSENTQISSIWNNRPIEQINLSKTSNAGTIRGMHMQKEPYSEAKLISCITGKVFDVAVDLRRYSPTFGKWCKVILSPFLNNSIFIPEGCAHGFQTMENNCEMIYIHSKNWKKELETGVNCNDKKLGIPWPIPQKHLSHRDENLPFLNSYG